MEAFPESAENEGGNNPENKSKGSSNHDQDEFDGSLISNEERELHFFCVTLKSDSQDYQLRFKKPEGLGTYSMRAIDENIKWITVTIPG